jgi:hypothetical protein
MVRELSSTISTWNSLCWDSTANNTLYIFNFVIGRDYNNTIIHISHIFTVKVTLWHSLHNKIIIKDWYKITVLYSYDWTRTTSSHDWKQRLVTFYLFLPLRLLLSQSLFMKIVLRFYKLIFSDKYSKVYRDRIVVIFLSKMFYPIISKAFEAGWKRLEKHSNIDIFKFFFRLSKFLIEK